jgi:hypothetical protein
LSKVDLGGVVYLFLFYGRSGRLLVPTHNTAKNTYAAVDKDTRARTNPRGAFFSTALGTAAPLSQQYLAFCSDPQIKVLRWC